jgi:RimJ/RimL family protein N-acetyltransferase
VKQQPTVVLERMVLRPLRAKDTRVVQRLARSRKVAYLTHWLFLPHSEQKALRWIDFTANNFARRSSVEFTIQLKQGGRNIEHRTSNIQRRTSNLEP